MPEQRIIAAMGATGAQGGGLVRAIRDDPSAGFTVRAITRDVNALSKTEVPMLFNVLVRLMALVAVLSPVVAVAAPSNAALTLERELAAVRRATAKYHDVEKALADGYIAALHCVSVPGLGGMGYHYIKPSLATDLALDPLQPEFLLYAPSGSGLRLVAVEYFVANVGQERPEVMGIPLHGPMPGHEPGMPEHYDLHAWIWQPNPNGMFADFNPNVSCETADEHQGEE